MKTVYIENVFLLNLVMNLYLFRLTGFILRKSTTLLRILLGSVAGALGYCISICFFNDSQSLLMVLVMLPVSVLGCFFVFKGKTIYEVLRHTGYLYCVAFFLGGGLLFLQRQIPFLQQMKSSAILILVCAGVMYEGGRVLIRFLQKRKENPFCTVILQGESEELQITALIDTGNGLREPVSGRSVSILEEEVFRKMKDRLLPEKLKVIPYHSVGKTHGIMMGMEVSNIKIRTDDGEKVLPEGILAMYQGRLSESGSYQMILSPEWIS